MLDAESIVQPGAGLSFLKESPVVNGLHYISFRTPEVFPTHRLFLASCLININ
jgi:hypothetical protein